MENRRQPDPQLRQQTLPIVLVCIDDALEIDSWPRAEFPPRARLVCKIAGMRRQVSPDRPLSWHPWYVKRKQASVRFFASVNWQ